MTDNFEIAELLIKHGADVNNQNNNGETALFKTRRTKIAKLLIEHGADVNIQDNTGQTALFFKYDPDIIELLIKHGADVNIQDNNGQTAAMKASNNDNYGLMHLLNKHSADSNTNR